MSTKNRIETLTDIASEVLERIKFLEKESASPRVLCQEAAGLTDQQGERMRQIFLQLEERLPALKRICADTVYAVDLAFDVPRKEKRDG